jgi:SAM-dependent methyltransferase
MTWHETIEYIRSKPEYENLVKQAYFDKDVPLNIERFRESEEFSETLRLLRSLKPDARSILEIGAGNGIAAVNFARIGYEVTAVEPDDSDTVGAGAIEQMAVRYQLSNLRTFRNYAEEIGFADGSFDIVYIRQAMHHAYDLKKFIAESARVLAKDGILITVRDHVIYDQADKDWFLQMHPLHKFYGGENAFTREEYRAALIDAGLDILQELRHYETPINYAPITKLEIINAAKKKEEQLKITLRGKISILSSVPGVFQLYKKKNGLTSADKYFDERAIPGRMHSFITRKK